MQSSIEELTYGIRGPLRGLVFSSEVLAHFHRNRQQRSHSCEAGGQLFARFTADTIIVEVATGPYRKDKRSRFLFTPDRRREQHDIDGHFAQRLHFLGNWHTHPQGVPSPSGTDLNNTRQRFLKSEHNLSAFLMVIVGRNPFPGGLYVALVNEIAVNPLVVTRNSASVDD